MSALVEVMPLLSRGAAERSTPAPRLSRSEWVSRCSARLIELRPAESAEDVLHLVEDLWRVEPQFNPELAAEIEHESWPWEH